MFRVGNSSVLSSLSNLGLASYLLFKIIYFFPNCFNTEEELHRVVLGLGTWMLRQRDQHSKKCLWSVPVAVEVVVNLSVQESWEGRRCNAAFPSMPSRCVFVRASFFFQLKKQLWFITCF